VTFALSVNSRTKSLVKLTWSEKMTVLSTFLEFSLNFLLNNVKKSLQNLVQSGRKAVSKLKYLETQFERTVKNKIAGKTHLE